MAYKVFISSTYLDNKRRRKIVEDAIIGADMLPLGMERFAASENPIVDESELLATECDLYVGIVAHRYGTILDGHEFSITELEYRAAKAAGVPRLVFEIDPSLPVVTDTDFDPGDDRWDKQKKLAAFRALYRADQQPAQFTDDTLGLRVLHTLNKYIQKATDPDNQSTRVDSQSDTSPEIEQYKKMAESLHAHIEMAGFKTRLRVPIDLEELYIPLEANIDLRGSGEAEFADATDAQKQLGVAHDNRGIPLINALADSKRRGRQGIVLLGDPGSGKTTHLKRLLLMCLRESGSALGLESDTLPVLLPLRDLEDLSSGLDSFIANQLDQNPHLQLSNGFAGSLLQRGRLLLLFDGLDEITDSQQRSKVSLWIEQFTQSHPSCFAVITCRYAGYNRNARLSERFLELHLKTLSPDQSHTFIHNWYRAVETGLAENPAQGEVTAQQRADDLIARLKEPDFRSRRVAEMTGNPLLLANLCLVHRDRGTLPKGRARLYDECVDVLLELWRKEKNIQVSVDSDTGRRVLQPVALWLHAEEERTRASADELAPVLQSALEHTEWRGRAPSEFLKSIRDESGILTGWAQNLYGFMHLGFQEYLAASEIYKRHFEGDSKVLDNLIQQYGNSWWQEVTLILLSMKNPSVFEPFMRKLLRQPQLSNHHQLMEMILEEATEFGSEPFTEFILEKVEQDSPLSDNQKYALSVLARNYDVADWISSLTEAGAVLTETLVDWLNRQKQQPVLDGKVITTANGGVELVLIPGGSFHMGDDISERGNEKPAHKVTVSPFYLGRYPVTNEEYGRFLAANPEVDTPKYWGDKRFNQSRQPVVAVSWHDSHAFAKWAGGRLPTEAEWEYACRAGTTTVYSWGDEFGVNRANSSESGSQWSGEQTSPVGSFEGNGFGLFDMHGNVWEWVQDCYVDSYKETPVDGSAMVEGSCEVRVLRGGSWLDIPLELRSADRYWITRSYRYYYFGFRLAQDL